MILDIDIRVSNDNGVQIQQFTKHFDSRFEGISGIGSTNNSITKGFEEFLAEFLSSSGRVVRNNLLTEPTAVLYTPNSSDHYCGNVEYTLKLGESQSVTGHIPLDKLFRLSELSKITNQSENSSSSNNGIHFSNMSQTTNIPDTNIESAALSNTNEPLVLMRNNFKEPFTLTQVDDMFCQFITTAVSRYEDSFYVENIVESNFAESS